jgi:hypothetical protein
MFRSRFDVLDFYHHRLTLHGLDSRSLGTIECASALDFLSPLIVRWSGREKLYSLVD